MTINLEFGKYTIEAIEKGFQCSTFRREKHGWEGATFEVAGETYRILAIVPMKFSEALMKYYGTEGFDSEEDMEYFYSREYDLATDGYMHFFAPVPADIGQRGTRVDVRVSENGFITMSPDDYVSNLGKRYRIYRNPATGVITLTPST